MKVALMPISLPFKWASVTFIIAMLLTLFMVNNQMQNNQHLIKNQAIETLSSYRASIEKAISSRFNQVLALEAFVKSHQQDFLDDTAAFHARFDDYAASLQSSVPGTLSLQLAPNGIVKYITNANQNAKAMNHDLFKDDDRRKQVINTVKKRRIIVAGPVTLLQGGEALIARKAIFTDYGTYQPRNYVATGRAKEGTPWLKDIPSDFWGFATVLIDINRLYAEVFTGSLPEGVSLALRGRHGLGNQGDIFWGSPETFESPAATTDISLPGGNWVLAIKLDSSNSSALLVMILGTFVAFIAAYAVFIRQRSIEINMMSKARTEFLASMSHELRTPINGVLGMSELLEDTDLNQQQQNYLNNIVMCSQSLLRLIDDILDVTKISANKMRIESCEYDPIAIIQQSLLAVHVQAQNKGLAVFQHIQQNFPNRCLGDPTRLQQILINLLSNAVKFTEHGEVRLTATLNETPSKPMLEIVISDTGIGIAYSQQQRIFEAFTQADETVTRHFGGTGLGMMICKNLVELMNGTLDLESQLNKGTTVTIKLPYIPALTANHESGVAKPGLENSDHKPAKDTPSIRILVVDDVTLNREVASRLLQKKGYSADVAIDGETALALYKQKKHDIIFMDRHMPVMDGITATEFIRSQTGDMKKPWIIGVSASVLAEEREQCLKAGMNDFISKPVSAEGLQLKIEEYLASQK